MYVVTNKDGRESGEKLGKSSIFLVYLESNGARYWYGGYAHFYPRTETVVDLSNSTPVTSPNFNVLTNIKISYLNLRLISYFISFLL